jgi:hypothetical protein
MFQNVIPEYQTSPEVHSSMIENNMSDRSAHLSDNRTFTFNHPSTILRLAFTLEKTGLAEELGLSANY